MLSKLIDFSVKLIRKYLPDPFVFAIILTVVAGLAAIICTGQGPLDVRKLGWGSMEPVGFFHADGIGACLRIGIG